MKQRLTIVLAAAVTALVTTLAMLVIAGPPPTVTGTGTDLTRVKVIGSTGAASTASGAFVDVPGATANIKVDPGQTALIVARFAADSRCSGPLGGACVVQILIGGVEADPATGGTTFDSVPACSTSGSGETCAVQDFLEAHAMERWRTVGPGTYTVEVEFATGGAEFLLQHWTLEVDRIIV